MNHSKAESSCKQIIHSQLNNLEISQLYNKTYTEALYSILKSRSAAEWNV